MILQTFDGKTVTVRALIDPGSGSSFITERVAQLSKVKRNPFSVDVFSVEVNSFNQAKSVVTLILKSPKDTTFAFKFSALILQDLTRFLPQKELVRNSWPHIENLTLVDAHFNKPLKVDCILSTEIYSVILLDGIRKTSVDSLMAQYTVFG